MKVNFGAGSALLDQQVSALNDLRLPYRCFIGIVPNKKVGLMQLIFFYRHNMLPLYKPWH